MFFTNLNIFSIFLFLIIFWIIIFLLFKNNFKKDLKIIFLVLSFFLIFLSIFWIKYSWKSEKIAEKKEILVVLDVSKSMNVFDISFGNSKISRLDFAKKYLENLVLKNTDAKFSLVIFSWTESKSVLPFTNDSELFLNILKGVDYKNLLESEKTDFYAPFEKSEKRLVNAESKWQMMIFISDWADSDDEVHPEIKKFIKKDISYYFLWIWSEKWEKLISSVDFFWNPNYKTLNWREVVLKITEKNLQKLSEIFGGKYSKIENLDDYKKFSEDFENFEKDFLKKNFSENMMSFSRILGFFSFLFFVFFMVFYLFEQKKYVK